MEAMDLRKLKAELEAELERVRTARAALDEVPETTSIHVNVGGVVITCRDILLVEARKAVAVFAAATRGEGLSPHTLDVTSVKGERTVIPYSRIVMVRAKTEV